MAISRGNQHSEDQESSIKSRANEVYSEPDASVPIKSFQEYLRDTPPTPLSFELKGLLWVVGFVVAMLFVGALLRIQKGGRRHRPARPPVRASWECPQWQGSIRAAARLSLAPPRMDPMIRDEIPMNPTSLVSDQVPNSGRRVDS